MNVFTTTLNDIASQTFPLLFEEKFLELLFRVFGPEDSMSYSSGIAEDLVVIAARSSIITEKVYLLEILILDMLQAVGLVPTLRKDIERDHTTDGEFQAK